MAMYRVAAHLAHNGMDSWPVPMFWVEANSAERAAAIAVDILNSPELTTIMLTVTSLDFSDRYVLREGR